MADVKNNVLITKDTEVFVVPEVTARTPVFPTAANCIAVRDPGGTFKQALKTTPNDEVKRTRSRGKGFRSQQPPGTFEIPAYVRPSGVLGKAPDADALLKAGFGAQSLVKGLVVSGNAQPFDLANNQTLLVRIDGAAAQTVTFVTGDFVNIDAATAAEVVTKINSATTGCTATVTATNHIQIQTDVLEGGSVQITGGTANAVLGFDTNLHTSYVRYAPAFDLPSVCIWTNMGEVVYLAMGAIVNSLDFELATEGGFPIKYAGEFSELRWAGKAQVTAGCTTTTCVFDTQAKIDRFCEKMHVYLGTNNNAGAGFEITDIDYDAKTFTFSPALAQALASDAEVGGYLPAGTELGEALEALDGTMAWNDVAADMLSFSVTITNNAKYDTREKTSDGFPHNYFPGWRDVTGKFGAFYRTHDVSRLRAAKEIEVVSLAMGCAPTPARTVKLSMDQVTVSFPDIAGNDQREMTSDINAIRNVREDEVYLTFGQV